MAPTLVWASCLNSQLNRFIKSLHANQDRNFVYVLKLDSLERPLGYVYNGAQFGGWKRGSRKYKKTSWWGEFSLPWWNKKLKGNFLPEIIRSSCDWKMPIQTLKSTIFELPRWVGWKLRSVRFVDFRPNHRFVGVPLGVVSGTTFQSRKIRLDHE